MSFLCVAYIHDGNIAFIQTNSDPDGSNAVVSGYDRAVRVVLSGDYVDASELIGKVSIDGDGVLVNGYKIEVSGNEQHS